jgi:hypothetical protein
VTFLTKSASGRKISTAVIHSAALALSSLLTYWIVTNFLKNIYFASHSALVQREVARR